MYVSTCLCAGIHGRVGDQRSLSGVLLNFSTLFSEVGLLAAQEGAHLFDKATWLTSPGSRLHLPSLSTGICMLPRSAFYTNTGDLNLGPQACMANTLLIEPPLQVLYENIEKYFFLRPGNIAQLAKSLPGMQERSLLFLFGNQLSPAYSLGLCLSNT